ncbi:MAG: glycosyltransferase family 2 protein [Burkholderiales bacterium]|nr:glycosyltransferase family 2 protein [Burkholderiales bacterium]
MNPRHCSSPARPRLSAAIIARDEAHAIGACLRSIAWVDEVVVLDSGSTDRTVEICRDHGAHAESTDWPGFGAQKNRAIERCSGDWILCLDADERVSPELRVDIEVALDAPGDAVAFAMPRLSSYCGRAMRHGGWWPDRVTRLFRRGSARFSVDSVHERLIVSGPVRTLAHPLLHEAFVDLDEVLDKLNRYSSAGAEQMHRAGRKGSLVRALGHGAWTFVRTYGLRAGFLDGREGFMLAVSNAEGAYYRYLKLMLLEEATNTKSSRNDRLE